MQGDTLILRIRTSTRWLIALAMGIILLAACGGDEKDGVITPDAIPTRTLVPATPTPTPAPITATPSPTDLPAPSSLVSPETDAGYLVIPPAAQRLIEQTMDDLVQQQDIHPADVRLLSLEAFTWHDASLGCTGRYDAGQSWTITTPGYRILYSANNRIYAYHTNALNTFFLCEDRAWLALEGEPLLVDPIAASLVELTRRAAASRLDIPETSLVLASLLAIDWPDSSVGCPKPGGTYEDRLTPGYRIVFHAGSETIIYHTSIRDFVRCTPEEEILPGTLREAIPTATPTLAAAS